MLAIALLSLAPYLTGTPPPVPNARPPGMRLGAKSMRPGGGPSAGSLASLTPKALAQPLSPALSEEVVSETRTEVLAPSRMMAVDGFAYYAMLEKSQGLPADSDTGSACRLLENGAPLGPAGAPGSRIVATGAGAYSHWATGQLYFSASDNSNPLTNGRTYTLECPRTFVVGKSRVMATAPESSYGLSVSGTSAWNRRLVLRNLDPATAVRPVLRARDDPDLSSREAMLASILAPGMTPEAQAIAIWGLVADYGYNWHPAQDDGEVHDPVKFLNVYGYGYCDDFAQSFAALAQAAGLTARIWYLEGHVVAEAFYDGRWHMFDPDYAIYIRGADGQILGVEELAADPSPFLARADFLGSWAATHLASVYASTDDNFAVDPPVQASPHRMGFVLQPGDELAFDSGPPAITRKVYQPALASAPLAGNGTLRRTIAVPGSPAEVVIPVEWPYVLVGGTVSGTGTVAISADGAAWTQTRDFASWFAGRGSASYGFQLRVANPGPTLDLELVFQFAPAALPGLKAGTPAFDLTLEPAGGPLEPTFRGVEVYQEWEDRPAPGAIAIAASASAPEGGQVACSPDPVPLGGSATCTATANPGYAFAGWSGDCAGASCRVDNVTESPTVTARFTRLATFAVTAAAEPASGGQVACSANPVYDGATTTCIATPGDGFVFTGWSGNASCPATGPCVLVVTGPVSLTARFAESAGMAPRFVNISTRMNVLSGNDVLIGGFVIGGTERKTVVVRARGPSLLPLGVTGALMDPVVQLFAGQAMLAANDDWQDSADAIALQASGFAPADAREAAIFATLEPGAYTAVVRGANGATGVGLVEVFEVDRPAPTLANLSTRGPVFSGTNPMIAGFIIQGSEPKTVVVRARGPSLASAGIAGYLVNPVLIVYAGNRAIAVNDDWPTLPDAASLVASGFAPVHPLEAAVILTLPPGAYTAVVNGTGTSSGVAIVEVFAP